MSSRQASKPFAYCLQPSQEANSLLPLTHNALNDCYQFQFLQAVAQGHQDPFVWPYRSFGTYVMLAYLLLPPTKSKIVRYAFYPVFAFFVYWCWKAMLETKSASMAVTYLIGIVNSWGILWVATRTIFTDYRTARRVERRSGNSEQDTATPLEDVGVVSGREQDGIVRKRANGNAGSSLQSESRLQASSYYWQTLPLNFLDRFDFIVDLLISMRGPGWAHQARSIPGPPEYIASQLRPPPPSIKPAVRGYEDRESLLQTNIVRFIKFQIYLDIIKTLMTHDPYFLGFVDSNPPAPAFLPELIRVSPVLTQCYRLILAAFATRIALGMIFCLSPIFMSGIVGSQIMGLRAEPWYYSDFGGDWKYLLSDGIAGWWGAWWHQIFRLGFEAPARWACEKLSIPQRGAPGKVISMLVVFTCSGLLHASGSMCMHVKTNPWSGPFLFFMLQALGIVIESVLSYGFRAIGITQRTPSILRKAIVVVWLATWIYYTGPIIVDDFSRSGVWLFEPAPFSVLKMLGFGEPNDHWWRWKARNVFWYRGDRWWKSGLAV